MSERLHSLFMRGWSMVERDFSHACVDRVMPRLNAARAPKTPMVGEVLWLSQPTAFTLPGRYVYISRRILERCASDDPAAFALAHEMAHHDLGHLNLAEQWILDASVLAPGRAAAYLIQMLSQWAYSREKELAADAWALELCRKAGFDLKKCLECFDILAEYLLDHHDTDGVYGADAEIELDPENAANPIDWFYLESRLWWVRHRRSHPAVIERRKALEQQMAKGPSAATG